MGQGSNAQVMISMKNIKIVALYHFVTLDDYIALRERLDTDLASRGILGTILLAEEGINGTLAGSAAAIDAMLEGLFADRRFKDMEYKFSWADKMPFLRLKVRLKKEIVTLGCQEVDPTKMVGTYVEPEDWNALIDDPDVVVIDTRNDYEVAIGTFQDAISPNTESFVEFPAWMQQAKVLAGKKKAAMFCTGGIRCEKASSYMLQHGFDEIYHLHGGILKYLEKIPAEHSRWQGECFVFDARVSVDHNLEPGKYKMCFGCRHPVSAEEEASEHYVPGVCCPHCHENMTDSQRQRFEQRQLQMKLAAARHEKHLGKVYDQASNAHPE